MISLSSSGDRPRVVFDLEALESLSCGCVVSVYRTRLLDVAVVHLEAKGPYCTVADHRLEGELQPAGSA